MPRVFGILVHEDILFAKPCLTSPHGWPNRLPVARQRAWHDPAVRPELSGNNYPPPYTVVHNCRKIELLRERAAQASHATRSLRGKF